MSVKAISWQARDVLRALREVGALPGRLTEREQLLSRRPGGQTLNVGLAELEALGALRMIDPDHLQVTPAGERLLATEVG